ncbi:NUDIX hydrolase [Patescibacteria group bacterium]|nr:NUDIX hydrolase [Patescibacteria group bacterium]MBU1721743.1 NUDIX hydrolase [Patescibacteria group bacterium]MBU1901418.1 NUDIX hydrolase [Patescibacteria group bacterium]
MKIDFQLPTDGKYHQYCIKCNSEHIHKIIKDTRTYYECEDCKDISPRLIVVDPKIDCWVDEDTKEYWHKSVGIFVFNEDNEALFFERVMYPFVFTIPAGHLDIGEKPAEAVKRELLEETGLKIDAVKFTVQENIIGDKCWRGSDNHMWHLYVGKMKKTNNIILNDEGVKATWLTLEQALNVPLPYPVEYFIKKYGNSLFQDV